MWKKKKRKRGARVRLVLKKVIQMKAQIHIPATKMYSIWPVALYI